MLSDIKTADINAFKQSLAKKGNSPNTQHCRMRVIKSMFKWLSLMEYIDATPNFIMPKVPPKTENIYFPNDQFEAVLSFLDPFQKKIAMAYRDTGLRLMETQKCKLEDKGEGRWRIKTDRATSKTDMIHIRMSQQTASVTMTMNQINDPMREPSFLINLHSQLC